VCHEETEYEIVMQKEVECLDHKVKLVQMYARYFGH
jgi:hypothetical protein